MINILKLRLISPASVSLVGIGAVSEFDKTLAMPAYRISMHRMRFRRNESPYQSVEFNDNPMTIQINTFRCLP